ncbi:hypothetical protein F4604DRAFT_1934030 [Suillus subluteus]|nr:hypothetical protein F4604DRAFT_1934030 [Suillus subluteus]
MSKLSFPVCRKPPAADDDTASNRFKLSVLSPPSPPIHSPEDSDDNEEESGIVFADGGRKDEPDSR